MVCPKCGEELPYSARFCDACGTQIEQNTKKDNAGAKIYGGGTSYVDFSAAVPEERKLAAGKKDHKGKAITIVLFLSIFVILCLVGWYVYRHVYKTAYEKCLYDAVQLINNQENSYDTWMETLFPEYIRKDNTKFEKAVCQDEAKDYNEYVTERNSSFISTMDQMYDAMGDIQISYEIKNHRKLGQDELKEIHKYYQNFTGFINLLTEKSGQDYKSENKIHAYEAYNKLVEDFAKLDVKEAYEMEVEFKISNEDDEKETVQNVTLRVIEVKGKWMLDYAYSFSKLQDAISDIYPTAQ